MKHSVKLIRENNTYGITLIALVITIIVLLILAGVSIATLTGPNGLLTRTNDAKIETALGAVKEALKLEQGEKVIDNKNLTPEILLSEGKVSRTVQSGENDTYYMYYAIKENAYEGMQGLGNGNIASLKDVFLIDDNLNVRYIASNGKEYGDNLDNKVLDDETKIRFSSKAFSKFVSELVGLPEDEVTFKDLYNKTELTITDPNITSLEDLIFFPNLKKLTLGIIRTSPQIKTLDGIENCPKIEELLISGGPDKDYSALKHLKNLTNFERHYFLGSDFNNMMEGLKYCDKLTKVNIRMAESKVENMSKIKDLKNLTKLSLENCKISEIEGIGNIQTLQELYLTSNNISEIKEIDKLINLERLSLANNKIKDITPLAKNTELIFLNLKGNKEIEGNRDNYTETQKEALNKIGEILNRDGTIYLDVDKLGLFTNYTKLDLSNQNLTSLEPLRGITGLTELNLLNNQITLNEDDDVSKEILKSMTNLKTLNLQNNKLKDIKVLEELENLTILNLIGNNVNLKDIENIIPKLLLSVDNEIMKTILNCETSKITRLYLSNNQSLSELPNLSKFTNLKELRLRNVPIKNISIISNITSLEILDLSNNNLHDKEKINFSNLINLKSIDLNESKLWDEDIENLRGLRNLKNVSINLSSNRIRNATALFDLDPSTKISLGKNVDLTKETKEKLQERFGSNVSF